MLALQSLFVWGGGGGGGGDDCVQLRDFEARVLESTHSEPYIVVSGLQVQKTKEKKKKKKNKKRKRKHKKKKDSSDSDSDSSDSHSGSDSEERKRKKLKKVGESRGFGMVCCSHHSPSWNGVQACTFKLLFFLFLPALLPSVVLCEVQSVCTWPF